MNLLLKLNEMLEEALQKEDKEIALVGIISFLQQEIFHRKQGSVLIEITDKECVVSILGEKSIEDISEDFANIGEVLKDSALKVAKDIAEGSGERLAGLWLMSLRESAYIPSVGQLESEFKKIKKEV